MVGLELMTLEVVGWIHLSTRRKGMAGKVTRVSTHLYRSGFDYRVMS